ncbi:DUF2087 domain-containing protein [Cohnella nanjingensis]|uniref:DUF2087 domain-containing protein n=1 Tax=Cohnella nanjingensis TaxID=1387779 RepID=A0A7X0RPJ5_9BACL|nr:DUF2087 domain-containing protein [Cohnella nanjingensis]MBB6669874.1 DUF2087 domain-containing protein [Cohnella nanjingensis]
MNKFEERFPVTDRERSDLIQRFFPKGPDGPLSHIPKKEKRKLVVLRHLADTFEPGKRYTEKEVNEALKARFEDHATLRRNLIDYRFMDREPNGSHYWLRTTDAAERGEPERG